MTWFPTRLDVLAVLIGRERARSVRVAKVTEMWNRYIISSDEFLRGAELL